MVFVTEKKKYKKRDLLNKEFELVDLGFESDIFILFPTHYQKIMCLQWIYTAESQIDSSA